MSLRLRKRREKKFDNRQDNLARRLVLINENMTYETAHKRAAAMLPARSQRPGSVPYEPLGDVLKKIGFASYQEYLNSSIWADIREEVFKHKGFDCLCCGKTASDIHHRAYDIETMLGIHRKKLIPICRVCHEEAHAQGSLNKANAWIKQAMISRDALLKERRREKVNSKGQRPVSKKKAVKGSASLVAAFFVNKYCPQMTADEKKSETMRCVKEIAALMKK